MYGHEQKKNSIKEILNKIKLLKKINKNNNTQTKANVDLGSFSFNKKRKRQEKKKKRIPNSQNNIILPSGKHNIQHQTSL